jgi:hypothetical protein
MKNLNSNELINFARELTTASLSDFKATTDDPIVKKYLETISSITDELEQALANIHNNEITLKTLEADRARDRALSVFRRLMQTYELSEENSPEAIAYEVLNELWMDKYDPLPFMSLNVETHGIDELVFDLSSSKYSDYVKTLQLEDALTSIKNTNELFKQIVGKNHHSDKLKPNYDARELKKELFETIEQYGAYVNNLSELQDHKDMQRLSKILADTQQLIEKQTQIPLTNSSEKNKTQNSKDIA